MAKTTKGRATASAGPLTVTVEGPNQAGNYTAWVEFGDGGPLCDLVISEDRVFRLGTAHEPASGAMPASGAADPDWKRRRFEPKTAGGTP